RPGETSGVHIKHPVHETLAAVIEQRVAVTQEAAQPSDGAGKIFELTGKVAGTWRRHLWNKVAAPGLLSGEKVVSVGGTKRVDVARGITDVEMREYPRAAVGASPADIDDRCVLVRVDQDLQGRGRRHVIVAVLVRHRAFALVDTNHALLRVV